MKALILVGGFGTRLRPMTLTRPKPLVDFGNKSILCHQVEALAKAGVNEVILAIAYQPEVMYKALAEWEQQYGIKITCSLESEPLGTAGPIKLAQKYLTEGNESGLFFVFNSDIICDYPLDSLVQFHKSHGGEGTIVVTKVEEPSRYGVIVAKPDGQIERFVEKPQTFVSNNINAGLYIFNPSMISRVPERPCSIEREIFPQMATEGQLYQMELPGYWMDIGQPKDYLLGQNLYLKSLSESTSPSTLITTTSEGHTVIVDPSAEVDPTAKLGPNVVIGPGCKIQAGVRIRNSTILAGTTVKPYTFIDHSIIGWKSIVGSWVRITDLTCTGEGVNIKDESCLKAVKILNNIPVTGEHTDKILMM